MPGELTQLALSLHPPQAGDPMAYPGPTMTEPEKRSSFAGWLSRNWRSHPLVRVASTYCVGAWLVLQVAETVLPSYDVPNWVMQTLINVLVGLFPIVLLVARFAHVERLLPTDVSPLQSAPVPARGEEPAGQDAGEILRLEATGLDIPVPLSERRSVTTLACAVRGVSGGRDDPELLLGFIAGMDAAVGEIIERYDGARLAGGRNQIVVAFGYPTLHEDEVRRAAKAAQEILALVGDRQPPQPGTVVEARIGLHTDSIIVDETDGPDDEFAMLADNNAIAECVQAVAPAGGIAVSAASARLLSGSFALEEIDRVSHPRLGNRVPVYRLERELAGQWLQVLGEQVATLGRDHEFHLLLDHWQTVLEGEARYALVVADPGMGKSTLVNHVVGELLERDQPQLIILNCESYHQDSPFRPLISFLESRLYGGGHNLGNELRLQSLRDFLAQVPVDTRGALPLLASLLSIEAPDQSLQIEDSGKVVRQKTLRLIVELLQVLADRQPLLLVVEDLHWADPSTLALIGELLTEEPDHRIYGLFTARPGFIPPWGEYSQVIALNLSKLPDRVAEQLVRRNLGGREISPALLLRIVGECDGVPFYLEELTRGLLESGASLVEDPETLEIPPSLQSSLDARVARLGTAKPLLQLCSVLGQQFSYELLSRVVRTDDERKLRTVLQQLVREGLLYQKGAIPGATFRFKHRLLMESAYQSLLRKTRAKLHEAIAETIEKSFPELCRTAPVRMAQHLERSGDCARAIGYRLAAARRAHGGFANDEALAQIARGLDILPAVAVQSQRRQLEVSLQVEKGMVLLSYLGYTNPDVRAAFERAIELSDELENSPDLFTMIVGLWMYYLVKGEYGQARELGERLLVMARESGDAPQLLQAYYSLGYTEHFMGDMQRAVHYLRQAAAHDREGHDYTLHSPSRDDIRVHVYTMLAFSLWLCGDSTGCAEASAKIDELVEASGHPYAELWAQYQLSFLNFLRRDFEAMSVCTARALEIAENRGFTFFVPLVQFYRSFLITDPGERLARLKEFHCNLVSAGAGSTLGYMKTSIAEQCIEQGRLEEAESLLQASSQFIEQYGETLFLSENQRVQARLLQVRGGMPSAEVATLLQRGVDSAMARHALPLALRCALALCDCTGDSDAALDTLRRVRQGYRSADKTGDFMLANARLNQHNG
jgi:class 3 adenylate cyclase/tetratricopeptide (TPR) repeat protein